MAFMLDAYFGGAPGNRGQGAIHHRRSSVEPVRCVIPAADFQLDLLRFLEFQFLALVPERCKNTRSQNF